VSTRRIAPAMFLVFTAASGAASPSSGPALQNPSPPSSRTPGIVRRADVIYGRVQGSALLADLAFPDGDDLKPAILYVFGGRWRSWSRLNNQGNW